LENKNVQKIKKYVENAFFYQNNKKRKKLCIVCQRLWRCFYCRRTLSKTISVMLPPIIRKTDMAKWWATTQQNIILETTRCNMHARTNTRCIYI